MKKNPTKRLKLFSALNGADYRNAYYAEDEMERNGTTKSEALRRNKVTEYQYQCFLLERMGYIEWKPK